MSVLTDLRREAADALQGLGFETYDHWPKQIVPPTVFVFPGSPYILQRGGNTFADWTVNLSAAVVVPTGTNEVETGELDTAIEAVCGALLAHEYSVSEVSEPQRIAGNNAQYTAAVITFTTTINLT